MRALVLGNDGDADAGYIGVRAEHHGYELTTHVRENPESWPSLDGFDLVISLGSEWSVYWDHVQPQVQPELALLRDAADRDLPVFGICFGSQLLATAHGGTVTKSPMPEIGWFEVASLGVGQDLMAIGPWFQWHDDHWTLPPGATLLAKNENANQAFRVGRSFATQFHPELNEKMLRHWLDHGGANVMTERGLDVPELIERTVRTADAAEKRAADLFDHFLKVIAQ
jgi:GMP synthase-like glutamine amidotransferase